MVWVFMIIISLLIGVSIGIIIMYYRDRDLLKNHRTLYNELQNNRIKLNEYQKRLNSHFTCNIELLNRIAKNYRDLYQNMMNNASFFLPNIYTKDNMYSFNIRNEHDKDNEHLPIKAPLDYSENLEVFQKDNK